MTTVARHKKNAKHPPIRPLTREEWPLVEDNLGLVRMVANKIAWGRFGRNAPGNKGVLYIRQIYEDLYAAGVMGLIIAAQRYDPSRENTFGTWAVWWIRNVVNRAIPEMEMRIGPKSMRDGKVMGRAVVPQGSPKHGNHENTNRGDVVDDCNFLFDLEESEPAPPHVELLTLLSLVLDERSASIVRRRVIDEETLNKIGKDEGISKERVRQVFTRAMTDLKNCKPFMKAVMKQQERRERERRADVEWRDMMGIGKKIA